MNEPVMMWMMVAGADSGKVDGVILIFCKQTKG